MASLLAKTQLSAYKARLGLRKIARIPFPSLRKYRSSACFRSSSAFWKLAAAYLSALAERAMRTMAIRIIQLDDAWALRKLTVCVRRRADLPTYARELVQHLTSGDSSALSA